MTKFVRSIFRKGTHGAGVKPMLKSYPMVLSKYKHDGCRFALLAGGGAGGRDGRAGPAAGRCERDVRSLQCGRGEDTLEPER